MDAGTTLERVPSAWPERPPSHPAGSEGGFNLRQGGGPLHHLVDRPLAINLLDLTDPRKEGAARRPKLDRQPQLDRLDQPFPDPLLHPLLLPLLDPLLQPLLTPLLEPLLFPLVGSLFYPFCQNRIDLHQRVDLGDRLTWEARREEDPMDPHREHPPQGVLLRRL